MGKSLAVTASPYVNVSVGDLIDVRGFDLKRALALKHNPLDGARLAYWNALSLEEVKWGARLHKVHMVDSKKKLAIALALVHHVPEDPASALVPSSQACVVKEVRDDNGIVIAREFISARRDSIITAKKSKQMRPMPRVVHRGLVLAFARWHEAQLKARRRFVEERKHAKKARRHAEQTERDFVLAGGPAVVATVVEELMLRLEAEQRRRDEATSAVAEDLLRCLVAETAAAAAAEVRRDKDRDLRLALAMERTASPPLDESASITPCGRRDVRPTSKRLANVGAQLADGGWELTSEKRHYKYGRRVLLEDGTPEKQVITIPKTPSDVRSRANSLGDLRRRNHGVARLLRL